MGAVRSDGHRTDSGAKRGSEPTPLRSYEGTLTHLTPWGGVGQIFFS